MDGKQPSATGETISMWLRLQAPKHQHRPNVKAWHICSQPVPSSAAAGDQNKSSFEVHINRDNCCEPYS